MPRHSVLKSRDKPVSTGERVERCTWPRIFSSRLNSLKKKKTKAPSHHSPNSPFSTPFVLLSQVQKYRLFPFPGGKKKNLKRKQKGHCCINKRIPPQTKKVTVMLHTPHPSLPHALNPTLNHSPPYLALRPTPRRQKHLVTLPPATTLLLRRRIGLITPTAVTSVPQRRV